MCSCPLVYWYRQTPSKERGRGEHISRLKICYQSIAYTIKRKHKCSSSFLKFADFIDRDYIAMLFLLTALALESKCKDTKFFLSDKIILFSIGDAPSWRRRRLAPDERSTLGQQGVGRKALNGRPRGDDWAAKVPADEGLKRDIDIIRELLKLYSLLHGKVMVRSNQGAIKEQLKR